MTARGPALDRAAAKQLMATEYDRLIAQLHTLGPQDWAAPTCNTGWDVRSTVAHVVGGVDSSASLREQVRQLRAARKRGGDLVDAISANQVEEHADWSPARLLEQLTKQAPKAARGRSRTPGLVRRRALPDPILVEPPDGYERWTFGFLVDVVLTRDTWIHRTDIAAATARDVQLTADHDGVIVADIVDEWAERHGQPCRLTLTGPAGGAWSWGEGGPSYELDAVEFCRVLSGRGSGDGLLGTRVAV